MFSSFSSWSLFAIDETQCFSSQFIEQKSTNQLQVNQLKMNVYTPIAINSRIETEEVLGKLIGNIRPFTGVLGGCRMGKYRQTLFCRPLDQVDNLD